MFRFRGRRSSTIVMTVTKRLLAMAAPAFGGSAFFVEVVDDVDFVDDSLVIRACLSKRLIGMIPNFKPQENVTFCG